MELKELEKMKVDQLREEAAKLEGVEGLSSMKKQELIDLLCERLDIQRPDAQPEKTADESPTNETKKGKPETEGAQNSKSLFKKRLKALQSKRKQALADRDYQTLADVRMRIKKYKRRIKKESPAATSSSQ